MKSRILLFSLLIVCFRAWPVAAQVDPFEFEVYGYQTEGSGIAELESLNSFLPKGHREEEAGSSSGTFPSDDAFRTSIELTHGLTDRIEGAAYLNLIRPDGSSLEYAGSKYRLRGRLFEQGEFPIDLGW